ncbi:MAG: hypothetical protein ACPGVU_23285 [Limisphaerales bacterium]
MNLAAARKWVQLCAIDIDSAYGTTVFDEWMIVWMAGNHRDVVHYSGPRFGKEADFQKDLQPLKRNLQGKNYHVGDLEFARDAKGTSFDVLVMAGEDVFIIFNNTETTLADISVNVEWRDAQIPLVKLGELFNADPLTIG